jgi:predicted GNAT family N-acyltransferase
MKTKIFRFTPIENPHPFVFATALRKKVFVEEQGVKREDEFDEFENTSIHYVVRSGHKYLGTARWRFTDEGIKLERFAVKKEYRNQGVGSELLNHILDEVKKKENKKIYLHAQLPAVKFYERAGFVKEGELFSECNIDHYKMVYKG